MTPEEVSKLVADALAASLPAALKPFQDEIAGLKASAAVVKAEPVKVEPVKAEPIKGFDKLPTEVAEAFHQLKNENSSLKGIVDQLAASDKAAREKVALGEKRDLVYKAIDTALDKSGNKFSRANAREHAYEAISKQIQAGENGTYLAPGNLSVDTFVADTLNKDWDYALVGAAGGSGFDSNGAAKGGARPQFESIGTKGWEASREQIAADIAQIAYKP